jgi:hypothetical protein
MNFFAISARCSTVYSFSILLAFTFQFGPQRIKCVGLVGFHYGVDHCSVEGQYIIKNVALIALAIGIAAHLKPMKRK